MDESLRQKILALLDGHRIMTVATLRPDGWPQATTVGYVSEGNTLWFLCGRESQKADNLARDNRVSITIDHDTPDLLAITGLSMAARAHRVTDRAEAEKVLRMLPLKYPDAPPQTASMKMPGPDEVAIFRVEPEVISVLDYTKGFAHTDLVTC
ncbi:pyridoxamine 5'-phosphate oxidase family protein [Ramlibacter tataouinensis]|uniref:pyridoxamine 5'-phosphate oxidase family protein n=1 Tax=Ramlibacter tataouinensis TaxID=94132 RepID=UPI0022F3B93B|nr:pyridoxamine 5'-phosphate oxidase family protein [Ramlibacter tataouinensis]WBY02987.1 pyridoxamine 5'-phosphate oxidase family protein [Ramlibacter tataouinensis]